MNVLIVDDQPINRKLLGAILECEGHCVTQAGDGVEALRILEAQGSDAVISDILMPNMDGYRLCLEVRQSERLCQIPFIAYTATYVSTGDEQAVLDLGADAYIRKPASAKHILQSLQAAVDRRRVAKVSDGLVQAYSEVVSSKLVKMRTEVNSKRKIARLNDRLKKSNERLNEVGRFKSEFLATASHEMRTPLTIIREFASILSDGISGTVNEEQAGCLDSILRNCDRLTFLINDLLDLATIESGSIQVRRESLDISSLLQECVADFQLQFKGKSQSLTVDFGEEPLPKVLADRACIQQVLVNLLGNAHKFTQHGALVEVSALREMDSVRVRVSDNGPGIEESRLHEVFDAFTQINRKEGPGAKGTGLGLTIAQKMLGFHGGAINVASEKDRGAVFTFSLPIYSARLEQEAFLVDRIRSARYGFVSTVIIIRPEKKNPIQATADWQTIRLQCDRALPHADSCQSILDDGTLLYVMQGPKPNPRSQIMRLLRDVPDLQVMVFTQRALPDSDQSNRPLIRLRATLRQPFAGTGSLGPGQTVLV